MHARCAKLRAAHTQWRHYTVDNNRLAHIDNDVTTVYIQIYTQPKLYMLSNGITFFINRIRMTLEKYSIASKKTWVCNFKPVSKEPCNKKKINRNLKTFENFLI